MSDSTSKRYLHLVSDATLIELRLHLVSDATPIELRFNWYQTQHRQIQNQAQKFNLRTSWYQILESSLDYLQLLKMVSDLAHNCQGQKIITFGYQMWPLNSARKLQIKLWYIMNIKYQALIQHQVVTITRFWDEGLCSSQTMMSQDLIGWSQITYLNSRFKIIKYETQGEFLKTSSILVNSVAMLLDENCSSKS